ncbi:MAG TPA: methyltransferase domain-containing protein [Micromonosporaceae bacterium]
MISALRTAEGVAALAQASLLTDADPLAAVAALRASGHAPHVAAEALRQAGLRARAADKFGPDATRMYFTRDGLQQATRRVVADRRAARLAADPAVRRVADLCCGIGADAIAFARAGMSVHAVDADPETVEVARANVGALGLSDRVRVDRADAGDVDLVGFDAVFCDPARRSGGRRVFDPAAYSPPWGFLTGLPERVPRTVLKLGPGIDHALIPAGAEAEWVSVAGDVVEAALWHGPLAAVPRRATVIGGDGAVAELTGTGQRTGRVAPAREVLYDPDGAVVRSHLVADLADRFGATLLDPAIAYLTADAAVATPYARGYAVREVLPFSLKRLRAALRARDVGRVTIKKRGSALLPERLRRDLRLAGDKEATVVLTRIAGRPYALLVDPIAG